MKRYLTLAALLAATCAWGAGEPAAARTWTSTAGDKIQAAYVEKKGAQVVLRDAAGGLVSIDLARLSAADRDYVQQQAAPAAAAGPAAGTVTFEVTTETTGKQFAPRHVFAIWVTDDQGQFVKTLECDAKHYIRFLVQWDKGSGKNVVDAVTSASLNAHKPHRVTWDCRNAAGELVQDGVYRVHVEFSEVNGPGPATPEAYLQFTKGPKPVTLKPKDLPHFNGLSLAWKPAAPPAD